MNDNVKMGDACAMQVARADDGAEVMQMPKFIGQFECYGPGPNGTPVKLWETPFANSVVNQGRMHVMNVLFGKGTASTAGQFMFLHGAALNTTSSWGDISASVITNIGASFPALTFNSTITDVSTSQSATFAITAGGNQTVSGAGIAFYTSASCGTAPTAAQVRLYCYGTFGGGSQQLASNNTVSATVTLSFA